MSYAAEQFLSRLEQADASTDEAERWELLSDSGMQVFSTPGISACWSRIRNWDVKGAPTSMPLLIQAWLAFLCGDAAALSAMRPSLEKVRPGSQHESSMLLALQALSVPLAEPDWKLRQAEAAVTVLAPDDKSPFMANAKLTLGQMLAGNNRYRQAAALFQEAADLFLFSDMQFPAAVSRTNAMLNLFRLGNLAEVMERGQQALAGSASFRQETRTWWNIVQLPIGMACCELGRPALAIRHLEAARVCIDEMHLFHMHGLLEIWLFRALRIRGDVHATACLLHESEKAFAPMHHAFFDRMLASFRLLQAEAEGRPLPDADSEAILLPGFAGGADGSWLREEMLAWLTLRGQGECMLPDAMATVLERLRFIGNRPQLQLFLVMTAELHLLRDELDLAEACLREAVEIWRETSGCAGFILYSGKTVHMVRIMDAGLHAILNRLLRERQPQKQHAQEQQSQDRYAQDRQPQSQQPQDSQSQGQHAQEQQLQDSQYQGLLSKAVPVVEEPLTPRECDILRLAAQGRNNKEIGETLYLGVSTVKWHINRIFAKLDVENRVQAIRKAQLRGEIPSD